ncbi:aspartate aminotransferase family protein [Alteribacter lacisalsi]|uniref:Acetylornithine aminotransferase n=1 Tax=Alteribacter lacisalsi TaxID=2045244 RepID=A0A2W0H528_9BACI|nr:acetylornithine transaminase [Alteribacter lacisalsi]PYZ95726.1 aspartate aminotransferase family protein [Alteribacter lacisalsi]
MSDVALADPLMNTYNRFPLTIVRGKGSVVWDDKGKQYLDFTSGIGTCNLGHVPEEVKTAVSHQLEELWHCSNLFYIRAQETLAALLTARSFGEQVFFCNSGAEANEAAVKLARKYAENRKGAASKEVITFTHSFHGRTLATLTATGQDHVKEGFAPLPEGFRHLPFNCPESLEEIDGAQTAAVLLELVQGEGGVSPADSDWVKELQAKCRKENILLMVDEVQTGMGRTGTLFAYEQYGITPDVMTLAKGLGSGFPIGAVVANRKAAAGFGPGTHGTTFGGNPLACTAGAATLEIMTGNGIPEQAMTAGKRLKTDIEAWCGEFGEIREVRGKGLLLGMELNGEAAEVVREARQEGLLILTAGKNVIRLLPPLTVSQEEAAKAVNILQTIFERRKETSG